MLSAGAIKNPRTSGGSKLVNHFIQMLMEGKVGEVNNHPKPTHLDLDRLP